MIEKLYDGLCLLIRAVTWVTLLLVIILAAIPKMTLEMLVDAFRGNE